MTREKFIETMAGLQDQQNKLSEKMRKTEREYIAKNRLFQDGETVELVSKLDTSITKKAIIMRAYVAYNNQIGYRFWKVKKDGTRSTTEEYFNHSAIRKVVTNELANSK